MKWNNLVRGFRTFFAGIVTCVMWLVVDRQNSFKKCTKVHFKTKAIEFYLLPVQFSLPGPGNSADIGYTPRTHYLKQMWGQVTHHTLSSLYTGLRHFPALYQATSTQNSMRKRERKTLCRLYLLVSLIFVTVWPRVICDRRGAFTTALPGPFWILKKS